MNIKQKQIIVTGLVITMLSLCGCAMGGKNRQANGNQSATPANYEPYGKYAAPIEVRTVGFSNAPRKYPDGDSINNNVWTRAYAEELGIKLNYQWFADGYGNYEQKLNVAIASGNLPDIFTVPREKFVQLAKAGAIADLSAAYETCIPEIKKIYQDNPSVVDTFKYDGKWVGFSPVPSAGCSLLWIRTDWLKKLGLQEPKTMDELMKVAEAFVKRDPDGNGSDDTLGLPLNKELEGLENFTAGYKGYLDIWLKDGTGQNLVYGTVQPEIKTALSKMSEYYKLGLVDKEYGVKNRAAVNTDVAAGKFGLYYGSYFSPITPLEASKKNDPNCEWKPIYAPSVDGTPARTASTLAPSTYIVVRKGYSHPEALFKMANLAFKHLFSENAELKYHTSPDGIELHQYAFSKVDYPNMGVGYRKTDNEKVNEALAHEGDAEKAGLNGIQKMYLDKVLMFKSGDQTGWAFGNIYGEKGSMNLHEKYIADKLYIVNEFYGSNGPAFAEKSANLYKMKAEVFSQIIMGGRPVDDFDQFAKNWYEMGGDAIVKEVNEWYHRKKQ